MNPNANVELQSSDSTTGMTSAIEGSYDIGMASRELKDEEKRETGRNSHCDRRYRSDRKQSEPDRRDDI